MNNPAFNVPNGYFPSQQPAHPNVAYRQDQVNFRQNFPTNPRRPFLVDPNYDSRKGTGVDVEAFRIDGPDSTPVNLTIHQEQIHDQGAFGVVFIARCSEKNEPNPRKVAIKKIYQDKTFRHRELPMMKKVFEREKHNNIVLPLYHFKLYESEPNTPDNQKKVSALFHEIIIVSLLILVYYSGISSSHIGIHAKQYLTSHSNISQAS